VKKLLVVPILLAFAFAYPAFADPGPADEVEVILGNCQDGTTILRAHNTQDVELGWLIRIGPRQGSARIVDQGRLAPGERVERTYEVPLGESRFFRIRLGLPGDGVYFSTEGATDRTDCPSPSPSESVSPTATVTPSGSVSPTATVTPSESVLPTASVTSSVSPSTSVLGGSGTNSPGPGGTAFTGSEVGWLIAIGMGLLLLGAAALRLSSSTR
jgi:hypothetical protein